MFATLDPTIRPLDLPSRRRVLIGDTVGFIRNLPTTLVKAFRATLEEVTDAALILHVVDVSSPAASEHTGHVWKVLSEIGSAEVPQILVLNKMDRLPSAEIDPETVKRRLLSGVGSYPDTRTVAISALNGAGIDELLALADEVLPLDPILHVTLQIPAGDGATLALLHQFGRVLETRYHGEICDAVAEIPESLRRRLGARISTVEKLVGN
jgi:GTP-binding protein HflX